MKNGIVVLVMAAIRAERERGASWDDAARKVNRMHPKACADVMDHIGNWPSSEPELKALQRVWP